LDLLEYTYLKIAENYASVWFPRVMWRTSFWMDYFLNA